jgi:hypothetical protein
MYPKSDSASLDRSEVLANHSNSQRISARELHGYVWGLMTVFIAFAISYPIACWRVSQSEPFRTHQSHVKSVQISIGKLDRN